MTDITDGPDVLESGKKTGLPRQTIADGLRVPNVAVFLKRTTLEFLQIIFNTREPGSFHYDGEDDTKTEIQITDQHAVDLEAVQVRPAIVSVRGPVSWRQLGLGGGAVEGRFTPTGKTTFNDLLTGSVAFSCLSREGIEAEQIAHLVFNSFKVFRPVLQKYGFFSIKSLNIGSETLVVQDGDNDDLHLIPVFITAHVQDRWSLDEITAKKLEKIIIESEICT